MRVCVTWINLPISHNGIVSAQSAFKIGWMKTICITNCPARWRCRWNSKIEKKKKTKLDRNFLNSLQRTCSECFMSKTSMIAKIQVVQFSIGSMGRWRALQMVPLKKCNGDKISPWGNELKPFRTFDLSLQFAPTVTICHLSEYQTNSETTRRHAEYWSSVAVREKLIFSIFCITCLHFISQRFTTALTIIY